MMVGGIVNLVSADSRPTVEYMYCFNTYLILKMKLQSADNHQLE